MMKVIQYIGVKLGLDDFAMLGSAFFVAMIASLIAAVLLFITGSWVNMVVALAVALNSWDTASDYMALSSPLAGDDEDKEIPTTPG